MVRCPKCDSEFTPWNAICPRCRCDRFSVRPRNRAWLVALVLGGLLYLAVRGLHDAPIGPVVVMAAFPAGLLILLLVTLSWQGHRQRIKDQQIDRLFCQWVELDLSRSRADSAALKVIGERQEQLLSSLAKRGPRAVMRVWDMVLACSSQSFADALRDLAIKVGLPSVRALRGAVGSSQDRVTKAALEALTALGPQGAGAIDAVIDRMRSEKNADLRYLLKKTLLAVGTDAGPADRQRIDQAVKTVEARSQAERDFKELEKRLERARQNACDHRWKGSDFYSSTGDSHYSGRTCVLCGKHETLSSG